MQTPLIQFFDPGTSGSGGILHGFDLLRVCSFPHSKYYWRQMYYWACAYQPEVCVTERVAGWAGQGGGSMFTFGKAYGLVHGVVDTVGVEIKEVEPTYWQRRLGLPHRHESTRDKTRRAMKKDQKEFCLARFPELASFDQTLILPDSLKKERPDIWAGVCIGYAEMLDRLGVPLGKLG